MGVYEKLSAVQSELKAPKGQYNSYGKYKYRSCEDILEAVKPILKKHNAVIHIHDEVEEIGDRFYIKAVVNFTDVENGETITGSAFAREPLDKKGMDGSQITGTASSYSRKYALNGLLLIDDTKDADTDEYHKQTNRKKETSSGISDPYMPTVDGKVSKDQMDLLKAEMKRTGIALKTLKETYKINSLNDMSEGQVLSALRKFTQTPDKA